MRNPFEDLGRPRPKEPKGEPVSGTFSCQHGGCYRVSTEARYLREVQILTWICPDGHISDIKDFIL